MHLNPGAIKMNFLFICCQVTLSVMELLGKYKV